MHDLAVFFDFDGTLFYGTTDINFCAMNMALADMGRPPIDMATANSTVGDRIPDICRRLLGTEDEAICRDFYEGIFRRLPEAIERSAGIEPDCVHMLKALAEEAPLAVCSNAEEAYLMTLLQKFDIKKYFSYVWYSRPCYNKKEAVSELKKLLNVENAIMVGDRAEDVSAGRDNGCITVALQNDFGARDAVGADYDAYSHRELEAVILSVLHGARSMRKNDI